MRPSLRTASPLGTDCESEAVGLMPSINETDGSLHLIGIAITCPYWTITCQYFKMSLTSSRFCSERLCTEG